MSMTKEEAIKYGENKLTVLSALGYNDFYTPGEYIGYYDEFSFVTAALSALRPITREQVEKMRGEWIKEDPPVEFYICSKCGESAVATSDHGYHYRSAFCPHCGTPMTDEAVEMMTKRLEVLYDTSG